MPDELAVVEENTEVKELSARARLMLDEANAIVVKDDVTEAAAGKFLAIVRKTGKKIEENRRFFTKPLNEQLTKINARFKLDSTPVKEADTIVAKKILKYQDERDKAAEAERIHQEDLAAKRQATEDKRAAAKGVVPATIVPPIPAAAPKVIKTAAGNVNASTNRKFRVIDKALVPEKHKLVDLVGIGKLVRAGYGDTENGPDRDTIPGIEIYTEKKLGVR